VPHRLDREDLRGLVGQLELVAALRWDEPPHDASLVVVLSGSDEPGDQHQLTRGERSARWFTFRCGCRCGCGGWLRLRLRL
jgi:hypothetical protein